MVDLHEADIGIEAVFAIAKQQRLWDRSSAIEFAGTVKEVLGSCHTMGITVDGFSALSMLKCIPGNKHTERRRRTRRNRTTTNNNVDNKNKEGKEKENSQEKQLPPQQPLGKIWGEEKEKEKEKGTEKEEEKGEKEKEKKERPVLPIPKEEDVAPFLDSRGKVNLELCRDTYMTEEAKAESRARATRKMSEVRMHMRVGRED